MSRVLKWIAIPAIALTLVAVSGTSKAEAGNGWLGNAHPGHHGPIVRPRIKRRFGHHRSHFYWSHRPWFHDTTHLDYNPRVLSRTTGTLISFPVISTFLAAATGTGNRFERRRLSRKTLTGDSLRGSKFVATPNRDARSSARKVQHNPCRRRNHRFCIPFLTTRPGGPPRPNCVGSLNPIASGDVLTVGHDRQLCMGNCLENLDSNIDATDSCFGSSSTSSVSC